jgi:hypothetical protein
MVAKTWIEWVQRVFAFGVPIFFLILPILRLIDEELAHGHKSELDPALHERNEPEDEPPSGPPGSDGTPYEPRLRIAETSMTDKDGARYWQVV